ncbi:MAG: 16S rRNA (cytidine(1402)-2'-O)-methyltransferase [Alphaproteobacteria bacterium]|nr:16S rRNA (cytidine(1402)-2'-O)-methyltransferase [Alphaproteobacteria bacterium]
MSKPRARARSASSVPSAEPSGAAPGGQPPRRLAPGLYVVATPIGNLGDITLRALEILRAVDLVACEDSRVTAKLLTHYGIRKPLLPYHEHNAARARPVLLERLAAGAAVALVSDAGTPLLSDPGFKLVRAALEAGHAVVPLPGASAALAALVASGLPSDRFLFAGFVPSGDAARRSWLGALAAIEATLIVYESPRRLAESLTAMAAVLGDRPAAVGRELTKLFEETRRGRLSELAAHYRAAGAPKGEVAVTIGPPEARREEPATLDAALRAALARTSLKQAVAEVAASTGASRRTVYARALALKGGG